MPAGMRNLLKRVPGAVWLRDRLYGFPSGPVPVPGTLRPVVYLPTWLEWEVMKQRPQFLMEAMADAGHEVWFVDPRLPAARSAGPGIHLVPSIRDTPGSHVILYTHFAPTQTLIDRYEDSVVIYDLLDDLTIYEANEVGMPAERTVRHHHRSLVETAEVVIASNPVIVQRHRSERDDLLLVENGVDIERFRADGPVAGELPTGTVIGYHGAIAPWFDFDLFKSVAQIKSDLEFVLVGPVDPEVEHRARELAELSNVSLLPAQPSERIAEFTRGFSVGILPFVVDEMTRAVTPLKMYEYLASEVPMVGTPLPACVAEPLVLTASDPESFARGISDSLQLGETGRRALRERAERTAWRERIVPLLERLDAMDVRTVSGVVARP